jgi:hypothetical protein
MTAVEPPHVLHAASMLCNVLQADLLGVEHPAGGAASAPAEPNLASADDLGDFFNAPAQPAASTAAGAPADGVDMFVARPEPQAHGHAAAQQQRRQQPPSRPSRPAQAAGMEPGKGPVLDDRVRHGSLCRCSSASHCSCWTHTTICSCAHFNEDASLMSLCGRWVISGDTVIRNRIAAAGGG